MPCHGIRLPPSILYSGVFAYSQAIENIGLKGALTFF